MSLIETLVSVVIGAFIVLAVGGLSERLFHSRTTNSSNSGAMALAERQMETLLADPNQDPAAGCTAATAALCGDATANSPGLLHGPTTLTVQQETYSVSYWVRDTSSGAADSPLITPAGISKKVKKITVAVTHTQNPAVKATIVRYIRPES